MIRTTLRFGTIVLGLLLASSCVLTPSSGLIRLGFDDASRTMAARSGLDTVQISLWQGKAPYPLNEYGSNVLVQSVGSTIVLDNIRPAEGFQLEIALGRWADGYFEPVKIATSAEFTVVAGSASPIAIELMDSPLVRLGRSASSIAKVRTMLYALHGNDLLEITGGTASPRAILSGPQQNVTGLPASVQVNSLSSGFDRDGVPVLWLNTNQGLYTSTNAELTQYATLPDWSTDPWDSGKNVAESSLNVRNSWAIRVQSTNPELPNVTLTMAFFNAGGLDMGMGLLGPSALPQQIAEWYHMGDSLGDAAAYFDSGKDILNAVAYNSKSYYIASSLGGFRLPVSDDQFWNYFNGSNPAPADLKLASPDGKTAIRRIATSENKLYLAPLRGWYSADIDSEGKVTGTWTSLPALAGDTVEAMATCIHGDDEYAAAVSNRGQMIVLKNGQTIHNIPAIAGAPGVQTSLLFHESDGALDLFIAGTTGLVRLPIVVSAP